MLYKEIFFTNVLRLMDEKGITKQELSDLAGISVSFLSDVTTGKANPSLKIMEAIADALEQSLPSLLQPTEVEVWLAVNALTEGRHLSPKPPEGFEQVTALLPKHQAYIVKKWEEDARQKLLKRGDKDS